MTHNSKCRTLQEAVAAIPADAQIAVGGSINRNRPMALLRALRRAEKPPRCILVSGEDSSVDLMRRFWPNCLLDVLDVAADGSGGPSDINFMGLAAAASGAASFTTAGGAAAGSPNDGVRVEAINPDVAVVHAPFADEHGNAIGTGRDVWVTQVLARASRLVIVMADEILSAANMARHLEAVVLDHALVDLVVHAPFGAHPTSCDRLYDADQPALTELQHALLQPEGVAAWCDRYVLAPADHLGYLDRATSAAQLAALSAPSGLSRPIKR